MKNMILDQKEIKEYFDTDFLLLAEVIDNDDAIGYNYKVKRNWFIENIATLQGKLLDVGCNVGNLEVLIRQKGITKEQIQITGIDIAEKAIRFANSRNIEGCEFIVGSIFNIEYPDNYFDIVCLVEIIEHFNDKVSALKEVYRVLKPNGRILLSTPNADCLPWKRDEKLRFFLNRLRFKKIVEKDDPITLVELSKIMHLVGFKLTDPPFYYWYRPYNILKGHIYWPPKYALKGLLNTMKYLDEYHIAEPSSKNKNHYQSLMVIASK